MSEKRGKPKATKGGAKAGADPGKSVLGNMPSTRPTRMSRRRDGAADAGATATAEPPKPKAEAKPRPVRAGSPSLKRPRTTEVPKPRHSRPPSGTELVTTAVQAAGELAEIGVKMGARAVKRAVDRLPKP
jgi:hypothetical protein